MLCNLFAAWAGISVELNSLRDCDSWDVGIRLQSHLNYIRECSKTIKQPQGVEVNDGRLFHDPDDLTDWTLGSHLNTGRCVSFSDCIEKLWHLGLFAMTSWEFWKLLEILLTSTKEIYLVKVQAGMITNLQNRISLFDLLHFLLAHFDWLSCTLGNLKILILDVVQALDVIRIPLLG